ncbi:hypothetical protein [Citrobacter amalonaticus]|uniref:hypothetical protein n=1 Tax=Citrobacter amalonaticus TaxID=35703 RepID=UPI00356AD271
MIAIPNERLRERAREKVMGLELAVTQTAFADTRAELEEELELARIALASLEAVPVYQVVYDSDTWRDINQTQFADHVNHGSPVRIVYAAPPAPQQTKV